MTGSAPNTSLRCTVADDADRAGASVARVKLTDLEGATDKPIGPGVCVRWRGALYEVLSVGPGWADVQLIGR
jgi:hypothetical protein